MQTVTFGIQGYINFQYDPTKISYKDALKYALAHAFNPDFTQFKDKCGLEAVKIDDLEGAGELYRADRPE